MLSWSRSPSGLMVEELNVLLRLCVWSGVDYAVMIQVGWVMLHIVVSRALTANGSVATMQRR